MASAIPDQPPTQSCYSLPLPPEIISRIFYYLNQAWRFYEGPVSGCMDLKSARLVCREFAALGASFLFERIHLSACQGQLDLVRRIARNPAFSSGVRQLIYDGASYASQCLEWEEWTDEDFYHSHVSDCDLCCPCLMVFYGQDQEDLIRPALSVIHTEACQPIHIGAHLDLLKGLYREQVRVLASSLHHACLAEVLPALPALRCVTYRPRVLERWSDGDDDPPMPRVPEIGPNKDPSQGQQTAAVVGLLQTLADTPNRVTSLDIVVTALVLHRLASLPKPRLLAIESLFSQLRKIRLYLTTPAEETSSDNTLRDAVATGVLSRLLGSARNLTVLKLSFDREGQRHVVNHGHVAGLPLATYLGNSSFPNLRLFYLSCISTTASELSAFLAAHRKLEIVEFDRIALARGQWATVGAAAGLLLPWYKLKCYSLSQTEEEHDVAIPNEWKTSEWHDGFTGDMFFQPDTHATISRGNMAKYHLS